MDPIPFSFLLELFIFVLPRSASCKIRSKMETQRATESRPSKYHNGKVIRFEDEIMSHEEAEMQDKALECL